MNHVYVCVCFVYYSQTTTRLAARVRAYSPVPPDGGVEPNTVYRESDETLTTVCRLFTQLLWPIFCTLLSCPVPSTLEGMFTGTTQDSVKQYLLRRSINGFVFYVWIILSYECIRTSQCRPPLAFPRNVPGPGGFIWQNCSAYKAQWLSTSEQVYAT